jgi:phytoene desaturase
MPKALIIGSGIAGLAIALRLRHRGYQVEVFEASSTVGGKLGEIEQDGFRWDMGPSLFTMPHLVDELIALFDEDPKKYFDYKKKDTVCNYFWEDGMRFSVPGDTELFITEASECFNTPPDKIRSYLKNSRKKYDLTAEIFLEKSLHKVSTYLSKQTLISLLQGFKLDVLSTLDQVNKSYFEDEHLVQLFNRYATYNGSSPYRTPGIMSMIPHLEMHYGTFYPSGGMRQIAESMYHLAKNKGVLFHLNDYVSKIEHHDHRVKGIYSSTGFHAGDIVVSNMDIYSTYNKLLTDVEQPKKTLSQERSSSALIFYWGINQQFDELDLHNIFFSEDYQTEFKHLFQLKTMYYDPTVYINITSKEEDGDAPAECENWFVMVNAPANYGQDWDEIIASARANVISKISRILNVDLEKMIVSEDIMDPRLIESRTSSHRGALYGTSSNSRFAAFLRHPNFKSGIRNLFYCGGSVHPGGGIPLCLLSAKIVSDLVPEVS